MNNIEKYLEEFYNNPNEIEQYKIQILKDYYYERIYNIIKIPIDKLLIGVTEDKNLIYFKFKNIITQPLILDRRLDTFIDGE